MKLKKLVKLLVKLQAGQIVAACKENKTENIMMTGKLQEAHYTTINEEMLKLQKENSENTRMLTALSKNYELLLAELQASKKELAELKAILTCLSTNDMQAPKSIIIYTDASFDQLTEQCAYGIVTVDENGKVKEYTGAVQPIEPSIKKNTISFGESYAIVRALNIVKDLGYREITVYTDNIGVRNWAELGNTKSNEGQWLHKNITELKRFMDIEVKWLKRRSCAYNTRADSLARLALAQCNFLFHNKTEDEVDSIA